MVANSGIAMADHCLDPLRKFLNVPPHVGKLRLWLWQLIASKQNGR